MEYVKFRGRTTTDKGSKLVYGDYLAGVGTYEGRHFILPRVVNLPSDCDKLNGYEVTWRSVSRFSSFYDRYKTEIYENDVLIDDYSYRLKIVIYDDGCFFLKDLLTEEKMPFYQLEKDEDRSIKELVVMSNTGDCLPLYSCLLNHWDKNIALRLIENGYYLPEEFVGEKEVMLTTLQGKIEYKIEGSLEKDVIDCGDNEDMFIDLALILKNDQFRKWQVVTADVGDFKQGQMLPNLHVCSYIHPSCYRDATVEEIIKHYKKEK